MHEQAVGTDLTTGVISLGPTLVVSPRVRDFQGSIPCLASQRFYMMTPGALVLICYPFARSYSLQWNERAHPSMQLISEPSSPKI